MKKISILAILFATYGAGAATYDADKFRNEILTGVDMIGARATATQIPIDAPGELGREVYEIQDAVIADDIQMYIPTSMYVRMGGGMTLDFATSKADPNIYSMAAEKIGAPIQDVLFLDDNYHADKTAKSAGMAVCGVYDKSSDEYTDEIKSVADYYISDFKELLDL